MSARRSPAIAVSAAAVLSWIALAAAPAQAHGAMGTPPSRALECGPLGGTAARSAACRAADAATGGSMSFTGWDNLRVPNVNGQDRQKIPDGKLCSGGLATFKGLDLARADWPTTTVPAGAAFTFQYRVTIAHRGAFRIYVTKDGYSPTQPLRWADLESTPFATVTDPPIQNGSYLIKATLPAHRTGRQIIYTIWQTTSTPDTYYSCSDVVFTGDAAAAVPAAASPSGAPSSTASATPADPATPRLTPVAASAPGIGAAPLLALLTGVVVVVGGGLFLLTRRRRPPDPARRPPGR